MKNALNKLSWQNSWVRALKWSMLKCGNHRQRSLEMKIRAKEYHVNLFTNGQAQSNLCNVVHPFIESNCRSTRIWLDLMLKRSLKQCVNWSQLNKNEYLNTMPDNIAYSTYIKALVKLALITKINNQKIFMKSIDYSYYYEQNG